MSEMAGSAVWIVGSVMIAELLGYLLHRLLHSGWIRWLSASHMKHHMVLYGPLQKQRPSEHTWTRPQTGSPSEILESSGWPRPRSC